MNSIYTIDQQRAARQRALNQFNRRNCGKPLNAAVMLRHADIIAVLVIITTLGAGVITAMIHNPVTQPGEISIKSEMTKAQLKTLQAKPEERHGH